MMTEKERDERHSLRVALMAAEATLSLVTRVTHNVEYIEVRRKETIGSVRKALAETDAELLLVQYGLTGDALRDDPMEGSDG